MTNKKILIAGTIFMVLAIFLGAFGTHKLKTILSPDQLQVYKTGVEYQFYHALGLLIIGLIGFHIRSKWIGWSGILVISGIILFTGSLIALSITRIEILGAITPIGGLSFAAGWICLFIAIYRS